MAVHLKKRGNVEWLGTESPLARAVEKSSRDQLEAYKKFPPLVREHAHHERAIVEGGYGRKQLYELIQNAADELIGIGGRVEIVLTADALYCANEGNPFTADGAVALLLSYSSNKMGVEIGRFGLGFKSVLGVTSKPEVFSQSGSFGFDALTSAQEIRRAVPDQKEFPTLRIGHTLDPRAAAAKDPVLAELMSWATTVVRLPRTSGSEWLHQDLADFPAQFLIFSTHVKELVLDDRVNGECRELRIDQAGSTVTLTVGDNAAEWRVFRTSHRPSSLAKKDGGYSAERDEVPVYWAVSGADVGRLWAFFPTRERVSTSGIFNAPWKLSDDRLSVLEGRFNDELLEKAADLFLSNLPVLCDPKDPGGILEMFPARGRQSEIRGYADGKLIASVMKQAPSYACLPDQDGVLRLPAELTLHPQGLPPAATVAWHKSPFRPKDWCHHSVDSKGQRAQRRLRVDTLISEGGGRRATVPEWLEAVLDQANLSASSVRALYAAQAVAENPELATEIAKARIVLTSDESLVTPSPGKVFLPPDSDIHADVPVVHPDIAANEYAVEALRALGIREVSAESLLDAALAQQRDAAPGADWAEVWALTRRAGGDMVKALLLKHEIPQDHVSVRTRAQRWVRLRAALLPGRVIDPNDFDDEDAQVLIDTDWHGEDLNTLRLLGAVEGPVAGRGSYEEPWASRYMAEARAFYRARCRGANPSDETIVFDEDTVYKFAGPATPLRVLSPKAAVRFAREAMTQTPRLNRPTLKHRSNGNLPIIPFDHPLVWLLKQRGVAQTSLGPMPLDRVVGTRLADLRRVLPVVDLPADAAAQMGLPDTMEALDESHWDVLHRMVGKSDDLDLLSNVYTRIANVAPRPETVRAAVRGGIGDFEPGAVAVATTARDAHLLRDSGKPYLVVAHAHDAEKLSAHWGFKSAAELISSELAAIPAGPRESLGDLWPMLTTMLSADQLLLEVQRCSELRRDYFTDSGRSSERLDVEPTEECLYVSEHLSDREVLQQISELYDLQLTDEDIDDILENAAAQAVAALVQSMREAPNDGERVLLAVPADVLRQRLPHELVEAYEEIYGEPDDKAVADLTLAVLGLETLSKLAPQLQEAGLQPPSTWTGGRRAIEFVRELGFDRGYAGFKDDDRSEVLEVEGPIDLPPLHDYQQKARDALKDLVAGNGSLRGMLSLPTGAGKTRVTVQALVEAMAGEGLRSPVLWVAQTDELCEQAVQSWAEVWRAIGPAEPLRISRLWSSNKAAPVDEGHQVVVATISKITSSSVARGPYEWLAQAACVVVDEAHGSTAQSYNAMLAWLGMDRGKERAPLVGLSATPFRGNVEENRTLANRYGKRRLDFAAFDGRTPTIEELQDRKILARVDHQVLEGASVPLTDDELAALENFGRLPGTVLGRLGEDVDRNRRLVESILEQPQHWPVLVFATSVAHSQTLAALLAKEGRTAASVSGETKPTVRRYIVDRFKAGEIQVLTNYGVFTQGFDAPAIRALYIARPTYSANLYQQMVGRGLRGELNRGKDKCLVVNVADNLERYGQELAFREFDYLWTS